MDTYFFSKKHFVLSPCELVSIWWCAQLCNSLFLMHSSFKKAQNLWSKVIWLISPILTESLSWRFRVNTWNLRDGFAYIIHWNVDRREKKLGTSQMYVFDTFSCFWGHFFYTQDCERVTLRKTLRVRHAAYWTPLAWSCSVFDLHENFDLVTSFCFNISLFSLRGQWATAMLNLFRQHVQQSEHMARAGNIDLRNFNFAQQGGQTTKTR